MNILSRLFAPKHLFSLRLQWTNLNILFNFHQSSTSLFDTLVINKTTDVSKSGLDFFMINNNFAITKRNNYPFFSLSCLAYSLTLNICFVVGDLTNVLTSPPNVYIPSSNCINISTGIMLSSISILIPKKVCLFHLTIDSSSKKPSLHLWYRISPLDFYAITFCHQRTK